MNTRKPISFTLSDAQIRDLSPRVRMALLAIGLFGLFVPNGLFLYYVAVDYGTVHAALVNPVTAVFIGEAFGLMLLFAWLIHRLGFRNPGWRAFIVLSVIGSMAFSIPAYLWWHSIPSRKQPPTSSLKKLSAPHSTGAA